MLCRSLRLRVGCVDGVHVSRWLSGVPCARPTLTLNALAPNPGHHGREKRLGRGRGGGLGKTSGRGHKGRKQRGRGKGPAFIGGQTPLFRRMPKIGFRSTHKKEFSVLNLDRIAAWIDAGRLEEGVELTMRDLRESGCASKHVRDGIALLGKGSRRFDKKVHLKVSRASQKAIEAIERNGGSVVTVYHTPLTLRHHLKGQDGAVTVPRPPPKEIEYYLRDETRGYLSQKVQLDIAKQRLQERA